MLIFLYVMLSIKKQEFSDGLHLNVSFFDLFNELWIFRLLNIAARKPRKVK